MNQKRIPLDSLKGKMKESRCTYRDLAGKVNISATSLSNKLNGKAFFGEDEIFKIVTILKIKPDEIPRYFFPHAFQIAMQNDEKIS